MDCVTVGIYDSYMTNTILSYFIRIIDRVPRVCNVTSPLLSFNRMYVFYVYINAVLCLHYYFSLPISFCPT